MSVKAKKEKSKDGLTKREIQDLRTAFDLFDSKGTGLLDAKEMKASMESIGYNNTNPTLYNIIDKLDTPEAEAKGGFDFDSLLNAINEKVGNVGNKEGLNIIYTSIIDSNENKAINADSIKKLAKEAGEDMDNNQINYMMSLATENRGELSFDDFYMIMTKKYES